ncbi:gluconate 2-dehydrogenase subunit 3 family protein [Aestuariivivens sp. NBU2969]|uniref:gluconate 2-dehydrogenase subunit 3 family protein n=1 Tax=Aestuariivivens sp. NBU2969 TaxID=2873267 RepID=UPI001CBD66BC|nr:gluconate 2-dehydrogenase subunit 3 family protein [Aestuariivivens sp. NBU2969]
MDRRNALKALTFSAGSIIATPTLLKVLVSCSKEKGLSWYPIFLNKSQAIVLEQITNVILPKTDTLGALDVNVPQFLDELLNDVVTKVEQENFTKGGIAFQQAFKSLFKKDISEASTKETKKMISRYFDLNEEDQNKVYNLMGSTPEEINDLDNYYLYKYLFFIRYYTVFAYMTSQEVKEGILGFNPYLGTYTACISR